MNACPRSQVAPAGDRSRAAFGLLCGLTAVSCAHIEQDSYGVRNFDVKGAEQMSAAAVERCLLTVERPRAGITLGLEADTCGEPPFDHSAPRLSLWRWPWAAYQSHNPAVLADDQKRILRWYRARGFYDARIVEVRTDPPEAADYDPPPKSACDPAHGQCPVDIVVVVEEGQPLRFGEVRVEGVEGVQAEARELLAKVKLPKRGQRFDELDYDRAKQALVDQLAEAGYPAARVSGQVQLDHDAKRADVRYTVTPGPVYRFGRVVVEGQGTLPTAPIAAAAYVPVGARYRQSVLDEAQQEVYALGAFSAVEVERVLHAESARADVRIRVTPLARNVWRVGVGVMSGALRRTETGELQSVPQWDLHLFGRYERRHVFGTLGRFTMEERPRMIFQNRFPAFTAPKPGNVIKLRLNQPGLLEKRTDLIFATQYDVGPDAYLGFDRHDVLARVSVKRAFLRRTVFTTMSLQQDVFLVPGGQTTTDGSEVPSSYAFLFLEQDLVLDLRDDALQPTHGVYVELLASQAPRWAASDWTAFRLAPDMRGYLPLPWHMVLAGRFALGAMFVTAADARLDATSQALGPNAYRLRGGGANSNRGFVAGELGAGNEGGLRRWESSLELRVRFGRYFGVVGFADVGDVNRDPSFRFNLPHPSAGFGLRYRTPVGPIRFDMGFRIGDLDANEKLMPIIQVPGAWHLTIGESF